MLEATCCLSQYVVAPSVTERVIHFLEVIQIYEDEHYLGGRLRVFPALVFLVKQLELVFEFRVKEFARVDSREVINAVLFFFFLVFFLLLFNVPL